jgi:hypothetical protein
MIKPSVASFLYLLMICGAALHGQESRAGINKRWIRSQPAIIVMMNSGDHLSGQPIRISRDTLYIYPSQDFPVGPKWAGAIRTVPLNLVDYVLLQKGGNALTHAHRAVRLQIPQTNRVYSPAFQSIRKACVYSDSLVLPRTMDEAFLHSKVLRQTFPDKHVRLSLGLGFEWDRVTGQAEKLLEQIPIPFTVEAYSNNVTVDLLDVSWRLMDRIIAGGQLAARTFQSSLYGYADLQNFYANYDIQVYYTEYRIYAEYAFFHVDRYFTRKYELVAGGGFLMGKPQWDIYYNYTFYTDPDNVISDEARFNQKGDLFGFQLRCAFHYYLFPGLSLWSGLEANLYPPWTIEATDLPTFIPEVPLHLQETRLNFSGIRFKLGVSIYL